jgi:hypothetical protein
VVATTTIAPPTPTTPRCWLSGLFVSVVHSTSRQRVVLSFVLCPILCVWCQSGSIPGIIGNQLQVHCTRTYRHKFIYVKCWLIFRPSLLVCYTDILPSGQSSGKQRRSVWTCVDIHVSVPCAVTPRCVLGVAPSHIWCASIVTGARGDVTVVGCPSV